MNEALNPDVEAQAAPVGAGRGWMVKVGAGLAATSLVVMGVYMLSSSSVQPGPAKVLCSAGDVRAAKDCEAYHICVEGGKEELRDCAVGFSFNTMFGRCQLNRDVICGDRATGQIERSWPSCAPLLSAEGSLFRVDDCHNVEVGQTCDVLCKTGYVGRSKLKCEVKNGKLTGEVPDCKPLVCNATWAGFESPAPELIMSTCQGLGYLEKCEAACDTEQGYHGSPAKGHCDVAGKLVLESAHTCKRSDCSLPSTVTAIDGKCNLAPAEVCSVKPAAGVSWIEESRKEFELRCKSIGGDWENWADAEALLKRLPCDVEELPTHENLDVSTCKAQMLVGDSCAMECSAERHLVGKGSLQCVGLVGETTKGVWELQPPVCKAEPFCEVRGDWKEPEGLWFEPCRNQIRRGGSCQVSCEKNFLPAEGSKKSMELTCEKLSDRSADVFFQQQPGINRMFGLDCQPIRCFAPTDEKEKDLYDFSGCDLVHAGATCKVACNHLYWEEGSVEATCTAVGASLTGRIDGRPRCTPKKQVEKCGAPMVPFGVDASQCAGKAWGESCEFTCSRGYVEGEQGSAKGTCMKGEVTIEGDLPTCTPLKCMLPTADDLEGGVNISACKGVVTDGTCEATCKVADGFDGKATTIKCTSEGLSSNYPTCSRIPKCALSPELEKELKTQPFVAIDACRQLYPTRECVAGCQPGSSGEPLKLSCDSSRLVKGQLPVCSPRACDMPSADAGFDASDCKGKVTGETCTMACDSGSTAVAGDSEYVCAASGRFVTVEGKKPLACGGFSLRGQVDPREHQFVHKYKDDGCASPGCSMKSDTYDIPSLAEEKLRLSPRDSIDLHPGLNAPARVVVRRGASFTVTAQSRADEKMVAPCQVTMEYVYVWRSRVKKSKMDYAKHSETCDIVVSLPTDAAIGEYLFTVKIGSIKRRISIVVLLNPFNKDCEEYMEVSDIDMLEVKGDMTNWAGKKAHVSAQSQLEEYLTAESGEVWLGSSTGAGSKRWTYSQFSGHMLIMSLRYVQDAALVSRLASGRSVPAFLSAMGNPTLISRLLTGAIGDSVCSGNWDDGDSSEARRGTAVYAEALEHGFTCAELSSETARAGDKDPRLAKSWERRCRSPEDHSNSKMILEQSWVLQQIGFSGLVPFCQCWVFGSVLTAMSRSIGMAARTVTTFRSAHDGDGDRAISELYARTTDGGIRGVPDLEEGCTDECEEIPEECQAFIHSTLDGDVPDGCDKHMHCLACSEAFDDSVWNFHVWNEVWFRRPSDKQSASSGWQVVDATPQETTPYFAPLAMEDESPSYCGPASKDEVYQNRDGCFDQRFIISEVNAWTKAVVMDMPGDEPPATGADLKKATVAMTGRKVLFKGKKFEQQPWGRKSKKYTNSLGQSHGNSAQTIGFGVVTRLPGGGAADVTFDYKKSEPSGPAGCEVSDEDAVELCSSGKASAAVCPKPTLGQMLKAVQSVCTSSLDECFPSSESSVTFDPVDGLRFLPSEYSRVALKLSQTNGVAPVRVSFRTTAEVVDYRGVPAGRGGRAAINLATGPTAHAKVESGVSVRSEKVVVSSMMVPATGSSTWNFDFLVAADDSALLRASVSAGIGGVRVSVSAVVEGTQQAYTWEHVLTADPVMVKALEAVERVAHEAVASVPAAFAAQQHTLARTARAAHSQFIEASIPSPQSALSSGNVQSLAVSLRFGADPNASMPGGDSLLHAAVDADDATAVSMLLSFGASACEVDRSGWSAGVVPSGFGYSQLLHEASDRC